MKGIVLAGGTGSRLWPITRVTSKQMLPVYDKPLIYYPISTLMLAGIREILIITTPGDSESFKSLLGDGTNFGVSLSYATQASPDGLAQAFIIGENFIQGSSCALILGDNIFHGSGLGHELRGALPSNGSHIFTYEVANPSQYGIITLEPNGVPISIEEKPIVSASNLAVTGLYFFDTNVADIAKEIMPSKRGELEITSVIEHYLKAKQLTVTQLSRGTAWLDTGNPNALHDAATYIRVIEERTGLKIACLEEIALTNGWVTHHQLKNDPRLQVNNSYNHYVRNLPTT